MVYPNFRHTMTHLNGWFNPPLWHKDARPRSWTRAASSRQLELERWERCSWSQEARTDVGGFKLDTKTSCQNSYVYIYVYISCIYMLYYIYIHMYHKFTMIHDQYVPYLEQSLGSRGNCRILWPPNRLSLATLGDLGRLGTYQVDHGEPAGAQNNGPSNP